MSRPQLEPQSPEQSAADALVLRMSRKYTRRSFAVAAFGAAAGYGFYRWIGHSRPIEMQPEPLRKAFQANAKLSRAIFDDRALAPVYPLQRSEELRVNGVYGLKEALVPDSWRLQLVGTADEKNSPRYAADVTAWNYDYENVKNSEDRGHDTKVPPSADTAEKMAPAPMVAREKIREERAGKMPRGREEAGESRSTVQTALPACFS